MFVFSSKSCLHNGRGVNVSLYTFPATYNNNVRREINLESARKGLGRIRSSAMFVCARIQIWLLIRLPIIVSRLVLVALLQQCVQISTTATIRPDLWALIVLADPWRSWIRLSICLCLFAMIHYNIFYFFSEIR